MINKELFIKYLNEKEIALDDEQIKAYQLDTSKSNTTYALSEEDLSNYYLVHMVKKTCL